MEALMLLQMENAANDKTFGIEVKLAGPKVKQHSCCWLTEM